MANSFFNGLNYTLSNEDTSVEYAVMPEKAANVLSIAGSGSRVIPLLAKDPGTITCIDTSQEQLYLAELRLEALRALDYEEYLFFLGYPIQKNNFSRQDLFKRLSLSECAENYFGRFFNQTSWEGVIYDGRWEKTFRKISEVTRGIIGKKGVDVFQVQNKSRYAEYMRTEFPYTRWKLAVTLLGNATLFNSLLYKGNFPQKNLSESYAQFYIRAFDKIFSQGPVCNNYFMQIVILGKIVHESGMPFECNQEIFSKAKEALQHTNIIYIQSDILNQNVTLPSADFISLSDIPSYLGGERERNFLQLLKNRLNNNGIIVSRYYMHIPQEVDYTGFENITNDYAQAVENDKVQMYTIEILKKT